MPGRGGEKNENSTTNAKKLQTPWPLLIANVVENCRIRRQLTDSDSIKKFCDVQERPQLTKMTTTKTTMTKAMKTATTTTTTTTTIDNLEQIHKLKGLLRCKGKHSGRRLSKTPQTPQTCDLLQIMRLH